MFLRFIHIVASNKHLFSLVYSSTIYSSQKMENQPSVHQWRNRSIKWGISIYSMDDHSAIKMNEVS